MESMRQHMLAKTGKLVGPATAIALFIVGIALEDMRTEPERFGSGLLFKVTGPAFFEPPVVLLLSGPASDGDLEPPIRFIEYPEAERIPYDGLDDFANQQLAAERS